MTRKEGLLISGKSVSVSNLSLLNSRLNIKSNGSLDLTKYVNTGEYPKSLSNSQISLNAKGRITVRDSMLSQLGYNAMEIALESGYDPTEILISNVNFNAGEYAAVNNAISIFSWASGAVITIKNCKFKYVSNALRISNRLNVPATINIINCSVDRWDPSENFAGFMVMEDYTSGSIEVEESENRFRNIVINVENLTLPNGSKLSSPDNLSDICGTGNADSQIFYIYNDKGGSIPYSIDRYPTINIK